MNTLRSILLWGLLPALLGDIAHAQWVRTNYIAGGDTREIYCFAVSGTNLFAGAFGGVFRSTDSGNNWTLAGLTTATVRALAVSGTNLYAGTRGAGVFVSTNSGSDWTNISLNSIYPDMSYSTDMTIAVSGTNLFAGTYRGVFRTTNSGATWTQVNAGLTDTSVYALAVSGTNLFAGTYNYSTHAGGVFRSSNSGASWTRVSMGLSNNGVLAFAVSGTNLFAGTWGGVFFSTNNGDTWTTAGLTNQNVWAFAVSGANIFAVSGTNFSLGSHAGDIVLSTDNGTSWGTVNTGLQSNTSVLALAVSDTNLFAASDAGAIYRRPLSEMIGALPASEVGVWQEITVKPTSGQFRTSTDGNLVTFDGNKAKVMKASADSLIVRVPEQLLGNRVGILTWPDTTVRNVQVVVRVVNTQGDTVTVASLRVRFRCPRRILYDEVTRATPPILQASMVRPGPRWRQAFVFLGRETDGNAAVRLLNTSRATPPLTIRGKIIAPDDELFDKETNPTIGNLLNIGNSNAGIQFPATQTGLYIIIVEAADTTKNTSPPWSFGPFPALYQIHLAGNVGLPRKLINGEAESARATRLDTYFNAPAPRVETLINAAPELGQFAETGLFKFANPVSVSRSPIAVLIPPTTGGFVFGTPPVRAAPPSAMGLLPGGIDPSVPGARTPGAAAPVPGTVIDFAQVPIPASVISPGSPPGVAAILGSRDGTSVQLPYTSAAGTVASLLCDMGSGNEIVDGPGTDFRVVGTAGTYSVAVSNTPFADTFVPLGTGSGETEFDLALSGLSTARYIRLTGTTSIDAIESINCFADQLDATIGPLSDAGYVTITMRRQKSPVTTLDPYLELISTDGSALGKDDGGFGDDTDQGHSDAALINRQLNRQGFYRFLGRGYDTQPDERSFGTFFTRLETAGTYDPVELALSTASEELTQAQKKGIMSGGPRQRDSYLFQAAPGTALNIVVNGALSGQTPALADPLVELYDPEDFLVAANDNASGRGRDAALSVTLPSNGRGGGALPNPSTYRIVVTGTDLPGSATAVSGGTAYVRKPASGSYELRVFTGSMKTVDLTLPEVLTVTPNVAVQGASGVILQVAGKNFQASSTVGVSGTGITVKAVSFVNQGQLTATVDIGASAPTGRRDVVVTNPDGKAGTGQALFAVQASVGKIALDWDAPAPGTSLAPPSNLRSAWASTSNAIGEQRTLAVQVPRDNTMGRSLKRTSDGVRKGSSPSRAVLAGYLPNAHELSTTIAEVEPNNTPAQAQVLSGDTLITVKGNAVIRDVGSIVDTIFEDDIEDLYRVTTTRPGLTLRLYGFVSDCDLFLIDPSDNSFLDRSNNVGATVPEQIDYPDLPAGTYLVGVSIYDAYPDGPDSTAYSLEVHGALGTHGTETLTAYSVYRSLVPNARQNGVHVGDVPAGAAHWTDAIPYVGRFYYEVTALYGQSESVPSNEVAQVVTSLNTFGDGLLPTSYTLFQNYPNPFNPSTIIRFGLPRRSQLTLIVFNTLGQHVATLIQGDQEAGYHEVTFNGTGLGSGVYFYRLQTGTFVQTKKLVLLH